MKILVDNMPDRPQQCLCANRCSTEGWLCMFTHRVCKDTSKCRYLKVRKGDIHVGKKEDEYSVKDDRIPCVCGSYNDEICKVGNSFAALYYIKCANCGRESEQFPTIKEARDDWNDSIKVEAENKGNMDIYTPYHYQVAAKATADPKLSTEKALVEGLVGMNSEAGEALDIWKKYEFHKHDLDKKAIALELGDVLWYLTEAAVALGYSLEDIMKMNIEKLSKRYPDGFDPERSKNRNDNEIGDPGTPGWENG